MLEEIQYFPVFALSIERGTLLNSPEGENTGVKYFRLCSALLNFLSVCN